jgi:hypothetical protein
MASLQKKIGRLAKTATSMGATAATAAALTVGPLNTAVSPPPELRPITADVALSAAYTTGPLLSLLDVLGVQLGNLIPPDLAPILAALGISDFEDIPADSVAINNTLNSIGFGSLIRTRTGVVIGIGQGSFATSRAYQALISSAAGVTWDGYDPLIPPTSSPTLNPNRTNLLLVLLRNPSRPNGGFYARFAPFWEILGVDTNTPPAGQVTSTGIRLNANTVDLTWAYDPMGDFPVTLNPFAVANSILAGVPTNLLGGVSVEGSDPTTSFTAIGVWLGLAALGTAPAGSSYYFTLDPNDLPLLEPLRLPTRIINGITGWNLPTPIANALQPAAKILVNIAYTDVVTPADIAANPSLADDYEPYDRTFDPAELAIPTPLYSRSPLTFDEYLRVPGDTLTALLTGIVDEIRDLTDHSTPEVLLAPTGRGAIKIEQAAGASGLASHRPEVDKLVADVKDEVSSKVTAAVEKVRFGVHRDDDSAASAVNAVSDAKRKTPVKDAIQKAGKGLKETADRVSAKVKRALTPKAKGSKD